MLLLTHALNKARKSVGPGLHIFQVMAYFTMALIDLLKVLCHLVRVRVVK